MPKKKALYRKIQKILCPGRLSSHFSAFEQRHWLIFVLEIGALRSPTVATSPSSEVSCRILGHNTLLYNRTVYSFLSQRSAFEAGRSMKPINMYTLQVLAILIACLASSMAGPIENRAVQTITDGNNRFSSLFFREVGKENRGNLITSPLSASIALSMAAYGSRGETEKEFKQVLHLPEESVARTGYSNIISTLNAVKDVELRLANKIFINKQFSVKPSFQELTQSAFLSASQNLDFSQNIQAADTINQWVEEQTNKRIKDLINPSNVNGGTAMVLVNAVYFKGNWKTKFDPKLTKNEPFHVTKNEIINVPTMSMTGNFKYAELTELNAKLLELPYKGEEFSMIIIVPNDIDGLAELEEKLPQYDIGELLKKAYKTEVQLHLPKFKIESSLNLNQNLKNLGIKEAFSQSANFEGISDIELKISDVVQKAFIEVNEEGSEAAGASGINIEDRLGRPTVDPVHIDIPFLVIIQRDNVYLFVARVQKPEYK
ncbi:antichymotrypsin-2-like isoform X7 [Vespa velutina]|uniref:antichymotrypsin-2-like isoform X7 n=1 Tax=Vespa velutina TaxID=202808 RepID=UPI001FB21BAA|nr:antichymotrypsin-2-like isoform X7 [Vespa velutina]